MEEIRRHLFIQLSEELVLKVISDPSYVGKQFYCTSRLNEDQVYGVWSITSGSQYASINQNGKVTINEGVINQEITIQCVYETYTAEKTITISYDNQLTVESPSEISGTSASLLARYNSTVVTCSWELLSGSNFATLLSDGSLTILDTGYINVRASYTAPNNQTYIATKQIKVVYIANTVTTVEADEDGNVTTETTTTTVDPETGAVTEQTVTQTVNEDGSSSSTTSETVTNEDGSSETTSTTTNSDGTTSETQSTTSAPDQETGAVTTESTTINYDENGDTTGSSENTTVENQDGSSTSTTTNFNANGDPTDQQNVGVDTTGNVSTQDVEYDSNGNATVTGYSIDTTNSNDEGREIEGNGINTEFVPFNVDGLGFICHIVFYTRREDQPRPPLVADTEDNSPNWMYNIISAKTTAKVNGGWPGFDIRWALKSSDGTSGASNSAGLQFGYCPAGTTTTSRVELTGKSLDGTTSGNYYDVTITYDPNKYLPGNSYQFSVESATGCITEIHRNITFDTNNLDFTIGYALDHNGTAIRHSNMTILDFTITKIPLPDITPEEPVVSCDGTHITLSCSTSGADIYYRLNQTGSYTLYSIPILINADTTIEAYSVFGSNQSETISQLCQFDDGLVDPVISCDGQNVSIQCDTYGAVIYYRIGTSGSWLTYTDPIPINDDVTVQAYADLNGHETQVITENCTYNSIVAPVVTCDGETITITCTDQSASIYYRLGVSGSYNIYIAPISISQDTTVQTYSYVNGNSSEVVTQVCTYIPPIHDYSLDYLTFNVLSAGTISWKALGTGYTLTIEYSINNGQWASITASSAGSTISVAKNDVVRFRGSNTVYAKDKNNYAGFEGGTANYNIEGNIMSLVGGDNFTNSVLSGEYTFCSIFKKSKVISAENLILPSTGYTKYCYRAMFSNATSLLVPPALPATTLSQGCYWYMFENAPIERAPILPASTLVAECYGYMFTGCTSLNYIKCLATTSMNANKALEKWTTNVASSGTFIKAVGSTWTVNSPNGVPSGWSLYDVEHEPIEEAPQDWDINDAPLLRSFKYSGVQVDLPYSINAEDGHSSTYSRGTYTFTSDIILDTVQPTYLWFNHADQSADIYIDNTFVETHWGGYNAFFTDITNYIHTGQNILRVILCNTQRDSLAPVDADFNFNATLGEVQLWTSPVLPGTQYGYDGFHVSTAWNEAHTEATLTITTSVPTTATINLTIDDSNSNGSYHYTSSITDTGTITFTHTISGNDLHLWNGKPDPHLYDITLEFYYNNVKYHTFTRPYGIRYYEYVIEETVNGNTYTGFLLNGQPYLLRGVCMHNDKAGKANALTASDYASDFALIQDLGCNFIRLAHYPHPKEVYDYCDRMGIIVQTEVPCVNKFESTRTSDYYDHLTLQYQDMVNQHYNHPCIMFWGLSNEITTDDAAFAKTKIDGYATLIRNLDSERLVGLVALGGTADPSAAFNNPDLDWFGSNIYVGWYSDKTSNNPTNSLNTRFRNITTNKHKALAYSEYGCGATQRCHSDSFMTTTNSGSGGARHDIEYHMWLHEGQIAAIKNYPQLLFTSEWQLFDIAVSKRKEGYTICLDGETATTDNNLKYLNDKGLVERDHTTKKDTYYLYKAWWNPTSKFVHICGKDYTKTVDRVLKCYTNDGSSLSLYIGNDVEPTETVTVTDNIATFTSRTYTAGVPVRIVGATTDDTITF